MNLRVYNTLTRTKEPFSPVEPGKVGMYLCGPTVYKSPHIGHMVGPVIFDAVKRYLTYRGFEVTWIVNITDVEDKLIDAAQRFGTTVEALVAKHTAEYMKVLADLGIDSIDRFPRATDHIVEIIALCETLIAKGCAYAAAGNVWFAVGADEDYGKLSGRKVDEQESGLRSNLSGEGKKNPADFGLWKSAKDGEPAWDSPWGRGRPGWHVECSAMAMKYLGETFDIHGGGMDLIFPHHENEIAQSESATGKPFARCWMHNGLTRIKTKAASGDWQVEKMAGSVGNVISAQQMIDEHGPDIVRYFLLATHYRSPIEFTDQVLADTKKAYAVFMRLFERIERLTKQPPSDLRPTAAQQGDFAVHRSLFEAKMDDDFNTAGAIAELHQMAGAINGYIESRKLEQTPDANAIAIASAGVAELRNLGQTIGLFRSTGESPKKDTGLADELMKLIIELRADARKTKNFALADSIRNGLTKIGVTLEDRPGETLWRKE